MSQKSLKTSQIPQENTKKVKRIRTAMPIYTIQATPIILSEQNKYKIFERGKYEIADKKGVLCSSKSFLFVVDGNDRDISGQTGGGIRG